MRLALLATLLIPLTAFHGEYVDMACMPCPETAYCMNGESFSCPPDSRSNPSQFPSTIEECVCEDGFHRVADTCVAGQTPYYYINGVQLSCPDNMVTINAMSTAPTACVCTPGYEVVSGTCEMCSFGQVKHNAGNQSCSDCGAGYHVDVRGETDCDMCQENTFSPDGATDCTACHLNSQSPAGSVSSDDCVCNAGYLMVGGACQACGSGTYKPLAGNDACSDCPANAISSPASVNVSNCTCNSGFSGPDGGECIACDPGKFKLVPGDSPCELCPVCPEFQYDGAPCQGSMAAACEFCPTNTSIWNSETPSVGVESCSCNDNLWGDLGGPCYECPVPKIRLGNVNVSTDVTDCLCPEGWRGNGSGCMQCEIGTYKDTVNDEGCESCAETFTTTGVGSMSRDACVCPAGGYLHNNTCVSCVEGYFKDSAGNASFCSPCRANSVSHVSSTHESDCRCQAGWFLVGDYCEPCQKGSVKHWNGDDACLVCPVDTFESGIGSTRIECEPCPANQTTNGIVKSEQCVCKLGFEFNATSGCEPCRDGTFRSTPSATVCQPCSSCLESNWYIHGRCNATTDTECGPCPPNSNLPYGDDWSTICNCNAGYELISGTCTECSPGTFKSTDANNSIPCQTCENGKKALLSGAISCTSCDTYCPEGSFVTGECTPTTSVVCSPCTICPPGQYSRSVDSATTDTTCGVHHGNGRIDTDCSMCEETFYCENSVRYSCGANGTSVAGSISEANCSCDAGFYRDGTCQVCPLNFFCHDGNQFSCPANSLNIFPGGSHVTDCQCLHFFYRTNLTDDSFVCAPCQPGDLCYDPSYYSCPDSRQLVVKNSSFINNCVCVDSYFNSMDDLNCHTCPEDAFCQDGFLFSCAPDRWTQSLQFQDEHSDCVCRSGTYDNHGVCETCPENFFCIGDNYAHECPDHSTSEPGSNSILSCECDMGYENVSYPSLACQRCIDGSFKSMAGNSPCEPCRLCSAAVNQEYAKVACSYTHNAVCDACDTCAFGTTYIKTECQDHTNTVCEPCSACLYDTQWQRHECLIASDTICEDITFDLTCDHGEYRGGHTVTSDSFCAPCAFSDTKFLSLTLHEPKSYGLVYNDPHSCRVRCLGKSKLRDPSNHSLGCISCETGNALFKRFTVETDAEGDEVTCAFSCKDGYHRVTRVDGTEDCVVPEVQMHDLSPVHLLAISNLERLQHGFRFLVVHSNHSRFVITVGSSAPQNCDRIRGCCYSHLWRVSTLQQAGFSKSTQEDGCSREPPLTSEQRDGSTLAFEISDSVLPSVATCSAPEHGDQECHFVMSLIDTIVWSVTIQKVVVRTKRATQHVAFVGLNQYIPLKTFDVDVFLAYRVPGAGKVYMIKTIIRGYTLDAVLRVAGMTQLAASEVRDCARLSLSNASVSSDSNLFRVTDVETEYVTYWTGNAEIVSAFYQLTLADGSDQDIVAVRNVSKLSPYCTESTHVARFHLVRVMAASGLGASAVYQLHSVSHPTHATYGELGTLVSYVVRANSETPVRISPQNLLAVYTRNASTLNTLNNFANATALHQGNLDFTYEFRQLCRAQRDNCAYEYLLPYALRSVHTLHNCSGEQQKLAREWLFETYGAQYDGGHVAAMCARMVAIPLRSSLGLLVQTQHALDRNVWMPYMDTSMLDIHAQIWANFKVDYT